jgi:lysine 6-dehydrogenase
MNVVVLGAGLVGAPMATDLAGDADTRVTVADISDTALAKLSGQKGIETVKTDLSDKAALTGILDHADMVVNAVPGFMGYATLQTIIERRKRCRRYCLLPGRPLRA